MKSSRQVATLFAILFIVSCKPADPPFDASGAFESDETIISAQTAGIIQQLNIQEGQVIDSGTFVGLIDTVQLHLRRRQLLAQISATGSRIPDINAQTSFYRQQQSAAAIRLQRLRTEQNRINKLFEGEAATQRQVDDIGSQVAEAEKQVALVNEQMNAQRSALSTQSSGLRAEAKPLAAQLEQVEDQIQRSYIINPVRGLVMNRLAETFETAAPGKPLYVIAPVDNMILRVYVTGAQLPGIKTGQKVTVMTDDGKGGYQQKAGTIQWISSRAEFTPKTIQTKDERATQVYAVKVTVPNKDGLYKNGMYGQVKL